MELMLALIGAVMNRIRGSGEFSRHGGTYNVVIFGLVVGIIYGVPHGLLHGAAAGISAAVGMWAGQQMGWGRYIGALAGTERKRLEEVPAIDALIRWLRPMGLATGEVYEEDGRTLPCYRYPRRALIIWGMAGHTLRGMLWGLLIYIPMAYWAGLSFIFPCLLAGSLMGITYLLCISLTRRLGTSNPDGDGWELSEIVYGFILWGIILGKLV